MCYHNLSLILEFVSVFGQPVNKLHLPYKGRIQDFLEGAQLQTGVPTFYLVKICRKLHENQ